MSKLYSGKLEAPNPRGRSSSIKYFTKSTILQNQQREEIIKISMQSPAGRIALAQAVQALLIDKLPGDKRYIKRVKNCPDYLKQ